MKEEVLRLQNVTQIEDGVTFLQNFNLYVFKGEIMGLLCLNDLGKEALINLICRNIPVYYGRIYLNEMLINNYEHSDMRINKVAVIDKNGSLVEDLTVTDNIFVLRRGFKKYYINNNTLNKQLKLIFNELNIKIDGRAYISDLSQYEKCVIELLKAYIGGYKLIIIKDISNYIGVNDLGKFFELLRYFCSKGISFLYVCNHHEEAFRICDRVSLMENGKILKVLERREFSDENIRPYIVEFYNLDKIVEKNTSESKGMLTFSNVWSNNLNGMSFSVEKGECVVLLDVNNTVLNDIVDIMNRTLLPGSGSIYLDGKNFLDPKNKRALSDAVGFINEQPTKSMVFREMSYIDNLCFLVDQKNSIRKYNNSIRNSIIQEYKPLVGDDIYAEDVSSLSNASIYNLIYYRMHLFNPKIVFCLQPFYGADMYLRKHILTLLNKLKQKGIAVVILAVNIEDSLVVADRLIIIENGKFLKEYKRPAFDQLTNI